MKCYPIFLSVVLVIKNKSDKLQKLLEFATDELSKLVSDYELIIVDNASTDNSLEVLKSLTFEGGLPNLQVYGLTKTVDRDTATWAGVESALGDFVVSMDPFLDDFEFLPSMLDKAVGGVDIVLAENVVEQKHGFLYKTAYRIFDKVYQIFNGGSLKKDAPSYRILNKKVINFIIQHPQPAITYRQIPVTGGFVKTKISYRYEVLSDSHKSLLASLDKGIQLLVSTTQMPMRLVTYLSLFGALSNLLYSVYVVMVAVTKKDIAPGWISLSLQQSGMFFLISLVLLVLGEYIIQMATLSNEGPPYHVAQEFTSAKLTRKEKLNIEEINKIQSGFTDKVR
ncbi:glycosyltransferase [Leeia oryzae]|uniref:glycosyltransferase n=1 Tax=Leeia oryzae TaxID=356662 RepID=UPI000374505C|nr:glycosyltransferase [Leeia oryzae]